MPFDLLIQGGLIVSMEPDAGPFIGCIGINGSRIAAVWPGSSASTDSSARSINAEGMIVMPGLVNGHVHGDMSLARGLGDGQTLREQQEWLNPLRWFKDLLSLEDRTVARELTYVEALRGGTTFICEAAYWSLQSMLGQPLETMRRVGIRAALVENSRPDFSGRMASSDEMSAFCNAARRAGVVPIIGMVSEESYNSELLRSTARLLQKCDALVHTHLAETAWRIDRVKKDFGTTPVRYLRECGLLSNRLIGSHCVWVDEAEVEMLAEAGARVVNTPVAEMKIADGIAPIPKYLAKGIALGLGTDGAMWNNSNDMFREMKALVLLHQVSEGIRSLSARQALEMATIRGAAVFGLEGEIGSITAGKRADIVLVDASGAHMRPLTSGIHGNAISNLVYCATASDVHTVIVDGRPVVVNKTLQTLDEDATIRKAQAIGERLQEQAASHMPSWL